MVGPHQPLSKMMCMYVHKHVINNSCSKICMTHCERSYDRCYEIFLVHCELAKRPKHPINAEVRR